MVMCSLESIPFGQLFSNSPRGVQLLKISLNHAKSCEYIFKLINPVMNEN